MVVLGDVLAQVGLVGDAVLVAVELGEDPGLDLALEEGRRRHHDVVAGAAREQLRLERDLSYEQLEPTLPPSLRRDYVPDNYYNAPTAAELRRRVETTSATNEQPRRAAGGGR